MFPQTHCFEPITVHRDRSTWWMAAHLKCLGKEAQTQTQTGGVPITPYKEHFWKGRGVVGQEDIIIEAIKPKDPRKIYMGGHSLGSVSLGNPNTLKNTGFM